MKDISRTVDSYLSEMSGIGKILQKQFGAKPFFVSYAGGVTGQQMELREDQYKEAQLFLETLIGPPDIVESWYQMSTYKAEGHPNYKPKKNHFWHAPGMPVLTFQITPTMQHLKVDHIHLMIMDDHRGNRHVSLSWM